jgi:hypothetical protein
MRTVPTMPQTIDVPAHGARFAAAVSFGAYEDDDGAKKRRKFSGTAYGGGVITDHGWWDAVAFDLAGVTAQAPMPVFAQHDPNRVVGVITSVTNNGRTLDIAGDLFTDIDDEAERIAAKADAGLPWQMSVGIYADAIEEVRAGSAVDLNGAQVSGPVHVMRKARVREVSFVALGADGSTSATVFNSDAPARRVPLTHCEGASMTTATAGQDVAAITAERDALKAQLDKLKADHDALQAQFSARQKAERQTAVKEFLGEQFTAEKAAPFMDMTDAQFAAVQAMKPAGGLPAHFTTETATGGNSAPAESVLVASAKAMFGVKPAA